MKILQDICKLTNLTEDDFNKDTMFMHSLPLLDLLYTFNKIGSRSSNFKYGVKSKVSREDTISNVSGKHMPIINQKSEKLQHREIFLDDPYLKLINANTKGINDASEDKELKVAKIKEFLTVIEEELFRGTPRDDGMSGLDNLGNYSIIFCEENFVKNLYFLASKNKTNMEDTIVILPYLYKDTKIDLIDSLLEREINVLYSTNPCMLLSWGTTVSPAFNMYLISSLKDLKLVANNLTVEDDVLKWDLSLAVLNPDGIRRADE